MAAPVAVPAGLTDLTREWLTVALGERVLAADFLRVGEEYGFTGLVGRVRLRYEDNHGDAPASLIAKLSGDAHYERSVREERFYRRFAVPSAPRRYYSAVDAERRRVVLLLEDMAGGRQGDVLRGCSVDDAAVVLDAVAPLHARWWSDDAVCRELGPVGLDPEARQERYTGQVGPFLQRYEGSLAAPVVALARDLGPRLAAVIETLSQRPQTLIHSDLHLDNLIFDPADGRPVAILDWQSASLGSPARDLALFLVGSLSVEDRRAAEAEFFARYLECLGVPDYTVADLRNDFALALLVLLAGTVGWLTAEERADSSGRERAVREAALGDGRLVAALLDHDAASALLRLEPHRVP